MWELRGAVRGQDTARLVAELHSLVRGAARTGDRLSRLDLHCDVSRISAPDLEAIDVLARLQVTAHRLGHRLVFVGACARLRELVTVTGLHDILRLL